MSSTQEYVKVRSRIGGEGKIAFAYIPPTECFFSLWHTSMSSKPIHADSLSTRKKNSSVVRQLIGTAYSAKQFLFCNREIEKGTWNSTYSEFYDSLHDFLQFRYGIIRGVNHKSWRRTRTLKRWGRGTVVFSNVAWVVCGSSQSPKAYNSPTTRHQSMHRMATNQENLCGFGIPEHKSGELRQDLRRERSHMWDEAW